MAYDGMKYRWDCPHDWLLEKANSWGEAELRNALTAIITQTDSDTLQSIFEREMDQDGYFKPLCSRRI